MKENVLVFSGYSNFFSWNLRIICRRLGKKLGTFLNAAKYLCRKTICHLFPEERLLIALLWARNLSDSAKNFSEKVRSFSFFKCRGHFGTFYQRFKLFLDLGLNVWASAEQFSTVFLKVHSRCGRVFLEPDLFLSKVGHKSCGRFVKAAKNVRRRTIWYLFPEEKLFRFSTLSGKLPDFEKNFSKKYWVFHFLYAKEKLGIFFKWNVPLIKYFERKTSRLWSKLLRQKSQFFIFRVQRTLWFFSRRLRLFFGLYA